MVSNEHAGAAYERTYLRGCLQVHPTLRRPRQAELAELAGTCGPTTLIYLAKNACYLLVQVRPTQDSLFGGREGGGGGVVFAISCFKIRKNKTRRNFVCTDPRYLFGQHKWSFSKLLLACCKQLGWQRLAWGKETEHPHELICQASVVTVRRHACLQGCSVPFASWRSLPFLLSL